MADMLLMYSSYTVCLVTILQPFAAWTPNSENNNEINKIKRRFTHK